MIHRDLKPDNVMLVPDAEIVGRMRVRLLDFGIAKLLEQTGIAPTSQVHTEADAVIGTPQYMSPEQCRGPHNIDEKTDVYALGVMLFESLAGRLPFIGQSTTGIMAMHMFEPPPLLGPLAPDVPPPLVELVMRMLGKDKDARPAMSEIATDLAEPEMAPELSRSSLSLPGFVLEGVSDKGPDSGKLAAPAPTQRPAASPSAPPPAPGDARDRGEQQAPGVQTLLDALAKSAQASSGSHARVAPGGAISTLGDSARQRPVASPAASTNWVVVSLLGCIALLLGGLLYVSLRRAPTTAPAAAPPQTAPPAPALAPPSGGSTASPAQPSTAPSEAASPAQPDGKAAPAATVAAEPTEKRGKDGSRKRRRSSSRTASEEPASPAASPESPAGP